MSGATWFSLAGVAVAFLVGWSAVTLFQGLRRRKRIRRRMLPVAGLLAEEAPEPAAAPVRAGHRDGSSENAVLAWLNARYPLAGGLRTMTIAGIAGMAAAAGLVPALSFFGMPATLAFLGALAVGTGLGWNVGAMLEDARRNEFGARFLVVLEDFHRMVRYGIATNQALTSVTAAAEEPVKASLRNVVLDTEFGVPLGAAMDTEARRVRISELAMLAAVVSTQSSTGGNLSESIANLAAMLRERLDNRARLKASTAESRITMIILAFVPFAGIGLQGLLQPELIATLLDDARHLLGMGMALIVAGLAISWMMIRSARR